MKMMRKIRHTRLGAALANRMLKVKRSTPIGTGYPAADLTIPAANDPRARPELVHNLRSYYLGHRGLLHMIGGAIGLVALAGWAKHRKLI